MGTCLHPTKFSASIPTQCEDLKRQLVVEYLGNRVCPAEPFFPHFISLFVITFTQEDTNLNFRTRVCRPRISITVAPDQGRILFQNKSKDGQQEEVSEHLRALQRAFFFAPVTHLRRRAKPAKTHGNNPNSLKKLKEAPSDPRPQRTAPQSPNLHIAVSTLY